MSFLQNMFQAVPRLGETGNLAQARPSTQIGLLNPGMYSGDSGDSGFGGLSPSQYMQWHNRPSAFSHEYNNGVDMGRQNQAPGYHAQDYYGNMPSDGLAYNPMPGVGEHVGRGEWTDEGETPRVDDHRKAMREALRQSEQMADPAPSGGDPYNDPNWMNSPDRQHGLERMERLRETERNQGALPRAQWNGQLAPGEMAGALDPSAGFSPDKHKPFAGVSFDKFRDYIRNHSPHLLRDLKTYGLDLKDDVMRNARGFVGGMGNAVEDLFSPRHQDSDPKMPPRAQRWSGMNMSGFNFGQDEPFGAMESRMRKSEGGHLSSGGDPMVAGGTGFGGERPFFQNRDNARYSYAPAGSGEYLIPADGGDIGAIDARLQAAKTKRPFVESAIAGIDKVSTYPLQKRLTEGSNPREGQYYPHTAEGYKQWQADMEKAGGDSIAQRVQQRQRNELLYRYWLKRNPGMQYPAHMVPDSEARY